LIFVVVHGFVYLVEAKINKYFDSANNPVK